MPALFHVAGASAGVGAADYGSPREYARKVYARLEAAGLRAHLDDRNEKVNLKIREAQLQKVPFMLVIGDREAEADSVSVRHRKHGDMGAKPVAQFIEEARALVDSKM